ncbi:glutamine synthetase family protein [Streptomyces sp. MST-110588]|uniref:glutamine synthetase family protein n=1 Tax=Streptomyces sp. MST-110588 TaxID=2833628 RepID=UPI001F5D9F74|nr:glutamine synthetase family protein [Streptomyces sp. MST-110588]UNO38940.1 glutamine synthetase [Streptomyces sp. MST-110588]
MSGGPDNGARGTESRARGTENGARGTENGAVAGPGVFTELPHGGSRTARPGGPLGLEGLRQEVAAGRVDTVRVAVTDAQGRLKGKLYDARHFLDQVAGDGTDMCAYILATDVDMRPLDGFALTSWATGYQDLRVQPDLSTVRLLPWQPGTALVHADAVGPDGRPVAVAPRQMLRGALARLAERGLSVKAGLETEFVLYKGSYADAAQAGYHGLRAVTEENLDYALDHDPCQDAYMRRLAVALAGAGLPVEAVKTESAPGQIEVTFPYGDALAACDGHPLFKHAARTVGARAGLAPTFMAAPETGLANGFHLHVSLWRDDRPVLADEQGNPSATARYAIAGLLDGLPQLTPLYAPTTNSYKRFVPDSFAPTRLTWGMDNRTCAVRVVGHGDGLHLEVRVPGADANPYLALAAALAAITHGLDRRTPPPDPYTDNAYRAEDAPQIPVTLDHALDAFRRSALARQAFGPEVVDHYAHLGKIELDTQRRTVTTAERERWFSRA